MEKAKNYSYYSSSIFEREITKETYGFLQEKLARFQGFFILARTLRKYPHDIAAHTLGYLGEVNNIVDTDNYYKPGDYIGISGIERSYEKELRGKKGVKIMLVDAFNREKGSFRNGMFDTVSVVGQDLITTLDANLQAYGEQLMKNKRGSIVAIEPKTGEILALVSSPSYDPNLLAGHDRSKNYFNLQEDIRQMPLFNRALMASYPPGSTFKIMQCSYWSASGSVKGRNTISLQPGIPHGESGCKMPCPSFALRPFGIHSEIHAIHIIVMLLKPSLNKQGTEILNSPITGGAIW